MLLTVNIGNARISVGVFRDETDVLLAKYEIATDLYRTSDEYSNLMKSMLRERGVDADELTDGILSSVVPQLTETVKESMTSIVGKEPMIVGPGMKTGFPIKIDNPSELGGDIVADVAAALYWVRKEGQKKAAVVAHVGTVTTVSAVNARGEFLGCAIFPGIRLSFETLHGKTAQLPNVSLCAPSAAIAKNSQDSVRSGVICGHAMMLDGFVERFAKEMKCSPDEVVCISTGRDAKYVGEICKRKFVFHEDLTLWGLLRLYQNTTKNGEV